MQAWKFIKKIFNFITSVILYSIFVILIIVGIMVLLYFADHFISVKQGNVRAPLFGAYVIISGSMEPTIHVYDAVITMRVDDDAIKKNDVITFLSSDPHHPGVTITHRVIGIQKNEDGTYAYRTKGDYNNVEDSTLVSYDNVIGKVLLRIPSIGKIQRLLLSNNGWLFIIVVPCLFIIVSDVFKLIKTMMAPDSKNSKKTLPSKSKNKSNVKTNNLSKSKKEKKK